MTMGPARRLSAVSPLIVILGALGIGHEAMKLKPNHVSLETMKIGRALPALDILEPTG
jgi:hypothetical protein